MYFTNALYDQVPDEVVSEAKAATSGGRYGAAGEATKAPGLQTVTSRSDGGEGPGEGQSQQPCVLLANARPRPHRSRPHRSASSQADAGPVDGVA